MFKDFLEEADIISKASEFISGNSDAPSKAELTKVEAKKDLDAFICSATEAIRKGDRISLVGFGTLSTTKRPARKGRNPQTGKEITIAAKTVVKFKASNDLVK